MVDSRNHEEWQSLLQTPVAVLLGGRSAEREVSLQSGRAVLAALQNLGIAAEEVDAGERGWTKGFAERFRHTFIALHGGDGEGGIVQALLQNDDISYTGSGMAASALAMDKVRSKYLWRGMGLPTADFEVLTESTDWEACINRLGKVMVKPASEGSSIGMSIAASAAELKDSFEAARQYQDEILAERWIEGAEFTVAILGDQTLPAIRLETDNLFYDYEAKYLSEDTRYICPCGLDAKAEEELKALALQAFRSLGCTGWGRVDFMQDSSGRCFLLEVNTVPGMTGHSLVPMAAKAAGISFDNLVKTILQLSITGEQP